MNWEKVEQILGDCTKQSGSHADLRARLPAEYAEFLKKYNGVEGFVGPEQYLILWPVERLEELNAAYSTREYTPGVILIGTDGSDTGFGVDQNRHYVSVPLVGMSLDQARDMGTSFEEFLEQISTGTFLNALS